MYNLYVDDELIFSSDSLDEVFAKRNAEARKIVRWLMDDESIDKYAAEDYLFELDEDRNMELEIEQYYLSIEEA